MQWLPALFEKRSLSAFCCLEEKKKMQNMVTHCLFHLWSMITLDSSLCRCCFMCISVLWVNRQSRVQHMLLGPFCPSVHLGVAGVYHRAPTLDSSLRMHQAYLLADPSHASCPAWQIDGPYPQMAAWLSGVWAVRGN